LTAPDTRLSDHELDPAREDEQDAWRVGAPEPVRGYGPRRLPEWTSLALLAVGIVLIAVASTVFFASRADSVYGARVDILYAASDDTTDDSRERILATQQELLQSRVVLAAVAEETARPLAELRDALTVEVGRDDLLRVTVGDEDANRARALAQSVAARYLELTSRLSPETDRGRRLIQDEIDRLTAGDAPLSTVTSDRVSRLQDRLLDLEVESATRPKAELLSRAYVLDDPLSPNLVRSAALGLLIGLLLATIVTVALLRRNALGRR